MKERVNALYFMRTVCLMGHLVEEKAGCFAVVALHMYCYYNCSVALLTVKWVGLQYVNVVFPDHTQILFIKISKPCFT